MLNLWSASTTSQHADKIFAFLLSMSSQWRKCSLWLNNYDTSIIFFPRGLGQFLHFFSLPHTAQKQWEFTLGDVLYNAIFHFQTFIDLGEKPGKCILRMVGEIPKTGLLAQKIYF